MQIDGLYQAGILRMAHSNPTPSATLTRRGLLSAVSAISVLSLSQWPGRVFASSLDVEAFLALSRKLIGRDDLSEDIAAEMLRAYASLDRMDKISALEEGEHAKDLADDIVAAWYTGESPDPDDLEVLTYTDALVWQALGYTKPMASCGGVMGYWADPPEA